MFNRDPQLVKYSLMLGWASLLPVWRSGGRDHLTFWEWVLNHTIWGPPVEYVPEEDYEDAFRSINGVVSPPSQYLPELRRLV